MTESFAVATVFCPSCDEECTTAIKVLSVMHIGRFLYVEVDQDATIDHLCVPV